MAVYLVITDPGAVVPRFDGVTQLLVIANSPAEAKALAKAQRSGDADEVWDAATVTEVVTTTDLEGWTFRLVVSGSSADVSYTAEAVEDIEDVAAELVTLLNATAAISNAAYLSGTLTIAGAGDGIGDETVTVTVTPPSGLFPEGYDFDEDIFFTSITDGGDAGDALSAAIDTTPQLPRVVLSLKP